MNSRIQPFKDNQPKPGPFDQKYVPIVFSTNKVTGAVVMGIEGTGTIIMGGCIEQACERLVLAYSQSEHLEKIIGTLRTSYGYTDHL